MGKDLRGGGWTGLSREGSDTMDLELGPLSVPPRCSSELVKKCQYKNSKLEPGFPDRYRGISDKVGGQNILYLRVS